ncbi:MAG: hypothetical protein EOO76_05665 [Novosphingobium sp.]|nr:MAG: hypothetical protein EOO76_05665 [Novosphingobium sp.]
MAAVALRNEERIGLGVAVVLHVGLVAALLWHPRGAPAVMPPDRIEVTLSDQVAETSTSPEPAAQAAPDIAPTIGEPAPAEPEPAPPEPKPEPPKPQPKAVPPPPAPRPAPAPRPVPKPTSRPQPPKPVAKPTVRPQPRPSAAPARPAARPNATPARPAARPNAAPARPNPRPAGATRVGDDFLKGVPGAQSAARSNSPPAQVAGPQVTASLLGAISRALRPHWQGKVPEGADSEKLITVLRWSLNRDGSLAGRPEVVRQEGITDANRPQAARHAEQAIRAVQLAAPFDLPDEYYNTWKRVTIRFDKRLSQ